MTLGRQPILPDIDVRPAGAGTIELEIRGLDVLRPDVRWVVAMAAKLGELPLTWAVIAVS